jgi:hypothetical protein
MDAALLDIRGLMSSSTEYHGAHFNCASAVSEVLAKVGLHVEAKTVLGYEYDDPAKIGVAVERELRRHGIPYDKNYEADPLTLEEALDRAKGAHYRNDQTIEREAAECRERCGSIPRVPARASGGGLVSTPETDAWINCNCACEEEHARRVSQNDKWYKETTRWIKRRYKE